jgi:hypothetical protein
MGITEDARTVISDAIRAVLPDVAVKEALREPGEDPVYLVAIGKAAFSAAWKRGYPRKHILPTIRLRDPRRFGLSHNNRSNRNEHQRSDSTVVHLQRD